MKTLVYIARHTIAAIEELGVQIARTGPPRPRTLARSAIGHAADKLLPLLSDRQRARLLRAWCPHCGKHARDCPGH